MISIFIASSGRPQMFRAMLESLKQTTQGFDIETVCVIDDDEEAKRIAEEYQVNVLDYSPTRRGALFAWEKALSLSTGDILVPAGDDQLFHPDWLAYALESHKNRLGGCGVVGMNDLAYDGNTQVATMFLFDRKYCNDHMGGRFAPPMYKYYCIDLEWCDKARMLERFYWDKRSIVEHLHCAFGKRQKDYNDQIKEDAGWMEADNQIFWERKVQRFPVNWSAREKELVCPNA